MYRKILVGYDGSEQAEDALAFGKQLADAAKAPGSILLVGSRSYGPLRRVLLGSVSRALAGSAPAPLIMHPRGMHEQPKAEPTAEVRTTA